MAKAICVSVRAPAARQIGFVSDRLAKSNETMVLCMTTMMDMMQLFAEDQIHFVIALGTICSLLASPPCQASDGRGRVSHFRQFHLHPCQPLHYSISSTSTAPTKNI
jgi:hypothetical protein